MRHLNEIKIEIINRCLLNCVHCSTDCDDNVWSTLSLKRLKVLIQEAHDLGCRKCFLSGGEPLLYPELDSFLECLAQYNMEIKIYTTGIVDKNPLRAISKAELQNLLNSGIFGFAFSLYSSNPTKHDTITTIPGSFEASLEAIKIALALGIEVEIHFVALHQNISDFPSLIRFARKLGIKQVSLLRFVPQGRGKIRNNSISPTVDELYKLRTMIKNESKSGIKIRIGSPFNILLLGNSKPCTTGMDRMIVSAQGKVYPCDALKHFSDFSKFTIFNSSLSEIIEKGPLFDIVRTVYLPEECRKCNVFSLCKGGCLAQRLLTNRSMDKTIDPACLYREFLQNNEPYLT
ncbi:MAG: radical SAM protein [Syntrophorhabdaceae bacterium]